MQIETILQIGIVGVALSGLMQVIKAKFATRPVVTKAIVVGLSIVLGAAYVYLKDTPVFPTILLILSTATTIYAFFFK